MERPASREEGIAFRIKRRFNAPREKVFCAWTEPEILKQWWCPEGWRVTDIELDLCVGGSFRIGMQRSGNGKTVHVRGNFREIRAPEMLSFTWQWENAFEQMPQTCVTVHFRDVGAATELSLIHENLPEIPVCLQHRIGWLEASNRLQRVLVADSL